MADTGLKIKISADVTAALSGIQSVNTELNETGTQATKSFDVAAASAQKLSQTVAPLSNVFDEVAASAAAMRRISKAIDEAAANALKQADAFTRLGRAPLQDIEGLRKSVLQLKKDISTGFRPIFTPGNPILPRGSGAELQNFSNNLKNVKPAAGSALQSVTDFGRIISDLPYGFNAVANNIAPFIEGFARIKRESNGTIPALKAFAQTLIGPGGLIFIANALPAVFLIASQGIMSFGRKSKEAKSEADELKKTLAEVGAATKNVEFTAFGDVAGDIAKVNALSKAVQDNTRSEKERKRALDDLKDINKAYFGDLTLQEAKLGVLTQRVNEYTDALIKEGIVKELQGELGKIGAEYVKQVKVVKDAENAYRSLFSQLEEARNKISKGKTNAFVLLDPKDEVRLAELKTELDKQYAALAPLEKAYNDASNGITEYVDQLLKLRKTNTRKEEKTEDSELKRLNTQLTEYKKVVELTNQAREAGLSSLKLENDAIDAQIGLLDTLALIQEREVKLGLKPKLNIDPQLFELEYKAALNEFAIRSGSFSPTPVVVPVNVTPEVQGVILPENLIPEDAFDKTIGIIRQGKAQLKTELIDLNEQIRTILEQGAENAAISVGEALGNIVSGVGGAEQIVRAFGSVLGDVIVQLGKMLITAGITVKALKKAIEGLVATPGGAVIAVAAGIAAIAVGQALKNSFSNVKPRPFATGGLVTAPTLGLIGEAGPEVVIPLDRLQGMIGGAGGTEVRLVGQLGIRGREIVTFLKQESAANSRIN